MPSSIVVAFSANGTVECVNRTGESIAVMLPDAIRPIRVGPFRRYIGGRSYNSQTALDPVAASRGPVAYPASVRRAGPQDIEALTEFVVPLMRESSLLPISAGKVAEIVRRCAMQEKGAIAGIIDGEEGIEASIGLVVADSDVSDERFFRAVWCGLGPMARKINGGASEDSRHRGSALLDFARWCHTELERGAGRPLLLQFDVATRPSLQGKIAWYRRSATQVGAVFALGSSGKFLPFGEAFADTEEEPEPAVA